MDGCHRSLSAVLHFKRNWVCKNNSQRQPSRFAAGYSVREKSLFPRTSELRKLFIFPVHHTLSPPDGTFLLRWVLTHLPIWWKIRIGVCYNLLSRNPRIGVSLCYLCATCLARPRLRLNDFNKWDCEWECISPCSRWPELISVGSTLYPMIWIVDIDNIPFYKLKLFWLQVLLLGFLHADQFNK